MERRAVSTVRGPTRQRARLGRLRAPSASLAARKWRAIGDSLDLSTRKLQIVRCLFDGYTETSTGRLLGISPHTVHIHLNQLFSTLDVHNRCQLIVRVFLANVRLSRQTDGSQASEGSCHDE